MYSNCVLNQMVSFHLNKQDLHRLLCHLERGSRG